MQFGGIRTAIDRIDADQNIVGTGFRVFDKNIEVTVIVKEACVDQLKFRVMLAASAIFLEQLSVREFPVWIFVKKFHVRMRRRGVEIIIVFFYILAVDRKSTRLN